MQQTTIATKYRDFQYRLLMGNIVTNATLKLWKLSSTDKCTFCNLQREDEVHMLCECIKIKPVWDEVRKYIKQNDKNNMYNVLDWSNKAIIFNSVHPRPGNAINFIILIVKQYIYRARCQNKKPYPSLVEFEIEQVYKIEEIIAQKKNKMTRHAEKWSSIKEIIVENEIENYINEYLETR